MEYQREERRIHLITYHVLWCTTRRKKVLVGPVAKDCNKAIQERCSEAGWQILALDIQPNYVHLYVRAWPTNSAYEVTKQCKMRTSHDLCKKYKQLMSMASLWTRSYFASTEAVVTSEMIAEFVEAQRGI